MIRYSIFYIRFFKVSFSIKLAVFLASGAARVKLPSSGGARISVTINNYGHETHEK